MWRIKCDNLNSSNWIYFSLDKEETLGANIGFRGAFLAVRIAQCNACEKITSGILTILHTQASFVVRCNYVSDTD